MATITTDLICNLKQPVSVTYLHGNLFSADNEGNTIIVHVMDNGEPATISGSVSASVIRADGATVAVSGTLSGNACSVTLPQSCYAVPGVLYIIIKLTSGTKITTVGAVAVNVYQSSTDTVVDPGEIIPSIAELIEAIEDAIDSIPADYSSLLADIAPTYSSSSVYSVGRYVYHDGKLYRCTEPIETAESWNAAHWELACIGNDLTNKQGVSGLPMMSGGVYLDPENGTATFTNIDILLGGVAVRTGATPQVFDVSDVPLDAARVVYIDGNGTISLGGSATPGKVRIGSVNREYANFIYGIPVFINGERYHTRFDAWVNYPSIFPRGLSGGEQMIVFDFQRGVVKFPPDFRITINGTQHIVTSYQQLTIPEDTNSLLVFYPASLSFAMLSASVANCNECQIIARIFRTMNYVNCLYPHTVCSNPSEYYNVFPEMALYGDSIAASYGGLGIENIISNTMGIRICNYGIGATGYLVRVEVNSSHYKGDGTPNQGEQAVIDFADNNILDRLTNDIADLDHQIIGIWAGTNDISAGRTVQETIAAMESCIEIIYNAGKLPFIISPVRRATGSATVKANLAAFVEAQRQKCKEMGVLFIDVFNETSLNPEYNAISSTFFKDGLHPNNRGYYVLSTFIGNALKAFAANDRNYGVR